MRVVNSLCSISTRLDLSQKGKLAKIIQEVAILTQNPNELPVEIIASFQHRLVSISLRT